MPAQDLRKTPSPVCPNRAKQAGCGTKGILRPASIGAKNGRICNVHAMIPALSSAHITRSADPSPTASPASPSTMGRIGSSRPRIGAFASYKVSNSFSDDDTPSPSLSLAATRTNWNVADASLRPLVPYHPALERHTSTVVFDASPGVVAARLSDCFWRRGIAAVYDDKAATAKARTWDNITFSVQLHRTGSSSSLQGANFQPRAYSCSQDGVIVEIRQLASGCPVRFHRDYCRPLLLAASGDGDGTPAAVYVNRDEERSAAPGGGDFPFPPSVTRAKRQTLLSNASSITDASAKLSSRSLTGTGEGHARDPSEEKILLALELATDLAKKDRIDASRLGMESLCLLSNADSSGATSALMTARAVLLGSWWLSNDPSDPSSSVHDDTLNEVQELVLSLIMGRNLPAWFESYDDTDVNDDDYFRENDDKVVEACSSGDLAIEEGREEHVQRMRQGEVVSNGAVHTSILRSLSLQIVVQSLQLFQDSGRLDEIMTSPYCDDDSILALLREVACLSREDEMKAHDATLATRCLYIIIQTSKEARKCALMHDAKVILEKAINAGQRTHAIFVREAERALYVLRAAEE